MIIYQVSPPLSTFLKAVFSDSLTFAYSYKTMIPSVANAESQREISYTEYGVKITIIVTAQHKEVNESLDFDSKNRAE